VPNTHDRHARSMPFNDGEDTLAGQRCRMKPCKTFVLEHSTKSAIALCTGG
jgi:hypothetical protein